MVHVVEVTVHIKLLIVVLSQICNPYICTGGPLQHVLKINIYIPQISMTFILLLVKSGKIFWDLSEIIGVASSCARTKMDIVYKHSQRKQRLLCFGHTHELHASLQRVFTLENAFVCIPDFHCAHPNTSLCWVARIGFNSNLA